MLRKAEVVTHDIYNVSTFSHSSYLSIIIHHEISDYTNFNIKDASKVPSFSFTTIDLKSIVTYRDIGS